MDLHSNQSRRTILKTALATFAVTTVSSPQIFASPKIPGETRVLILGGDYWHNGMTQERHWRQILGKTDWRLLFAQSSQFVTPAALNQTDLFIVTRYAGPDTFGWSPDGVIGDRPNAAPFMTDAQENAIVQNVRRGMGLLSMHCSIWNPERKKYMELLGVKEPIMHGPVQHVKFHDINQSHSITKGISEFEVKDDENFGADIIKDKITVLYKSTGQEDKRTDCAAWCRGEGKGRVVSLLAGHTPDPYRTAEFKTIMWRSAHWALNRDIPEAEFKAG